MTLQSLNPMPNCSFAKMVLGMKIKPHGSLQGLNKWFSSNSKAQR